MITRTSSVLLLIAQSLMMSCSADQEYQLMAEQGFQLHQQGQAFYCELQDLGRKSQVLWDKVGRELEESIPEDLPKVERKNMIAIRNAGLIRMFEAYPSLPQTVKDQVDQAETDDQEIAGQMRVLNDSLRQFDRKIEAFLETVRNVEPDSLENWQKRLVVYNCKE